MSIIQTIRDKYARWAVIGIALAIIGFLLMDASVGRSRLFSGGGAGSVGSVNGKKIDAKEFAAKLAITENNIEQQQPGMSADLKRNQALQGLWEQELNDLLLNTELKELGITISENERADMLYGQNPSQTAISAFSNQQNPYNPEQVRQTISQIKREKNPERLDQLNNLLNYMDRARLSEKYTSLFTNSINIPKWFVEKQIADNSRIAKITIVKVNYTDSLFGPDSTIKVSDAEIMEYVNKHKKQYKQKESRGISYVSFSAAPSAADSAAVKNKVASLINGFQETKDVKLFLDREGSDFAYEDNFILAKDMQQANKDSILKTPVGKVMGPYLDNTHYAAAKMVESKLIPDSVTVRHILIETAQLVNPQTGEMKQTRDTAEGRKIMNDSVLTAINKGISFDSVCKKFSTDPGSKDKGGVYKNIKWNDRYMAAFKEFGFIKSPGSKGVVYTDYGFHYIEVLAHMGKTNNAAVKVAYLAKPIETSSDTENEAAAKANTFAGKSQDQKSFDDTYEKELKPQGIIKSIIPSVGPNDFSVGALGESRSFVKKIYEAKKGKILQPEKVGMNYIVALLTDIQEEGIQIAATARMNTERIIKNRKKAGIIRKKLGNITTPEAAATALGKTAETIDSLRSSNDPRLSYEYKLSGAAFNSTAKGKTINELIEGTQGVYVVRVDNTGTAPVADANITERRKAELAQAKQMAGYSQQPIQALKEAATIKDKRSEIY